MWSVRDFSKHKKDISEAFQRVLGVFWRHFECMKGHSKHSIASGFKDVSEGLGVSGAFIFWLVEGCQVVLKGVEECFRVLQRISKAFKRVPGNFKWVSGGVKESQGIRVIQKNFCGV